MPVSSAHLADAGLASDSPSDDLEPVTLCQNPGASARSSSSTSSALVWMTTRTDSGILNGRATCHRLRFDPVRPAGRLRVAQADVQLAQLLLVDRARRVGEQVLGALRLRERDHVAQRLGPGHQHDEAVEADGDAAVRRRAVLQRVEQEAELGAAPPLVDLQRPEHLALHVGAVDPHRAAAELDAVQHDVVGLGDAAPRVGLEPVLVAVLRAR